MSSALDSICGYRAVARCSARDSLSCGLLLFICPVGMMIMAMADANVVCSIVCTCAGDGELVGLIYCVRLWVLFVWNEFENWICKFDDSENGVLEIGCLL